MRILRGQSNFEVSSQGFALFVVGLVLATFLGGAIRTILSSDRVQGRIIAELKGRFPRNEFQIGRTEVLLSQGIWPGLGLRLHQVVFKQNVCGKLSFVLNVPEATLPVDLWSFRTGRARLGRVKIENGQIQLDYRECPGRKESISERGEATAAHRADFGGLSEGASSARSSTQGIRDVLAEKGIQPIHVDWQSFAKSVESIELANFTISYERNLTWKLLIKSARADLSDDLDFNAKMDAQKSLPFGTLSHAVEINIHGQNRKQNQAQAQGQGQGPSPQGQEPRQRQALQWFVRSDFKEGHLEWHGDWDLSQNNGSLKLHLTQIPLKELSGELFQMGFTPHELKLRTSWMTCSAFWQGDFARISTIPLRLESCRLEGAYGRVELDNAFLRISDLEPQGEPAVLRVQKLQLQPLVESLGRQVLPAVLSRLGSWSGNLVYNGRENWRLEGFLENLDVIFANQSLRGKQSVRSMRTELHRREGAIQGKVNQVAVQDGECSGEIRFQLTDDWRSGTFSVQVERFSLSQNIQNILIGGVIAPVKVFGHGRLQDGELSQWAGETGVQEVHGPGWAGGMVEVKSRFASGLFSLDAQAAEFKADSQWRYFSDASAISSSPTEASPLRWRALKAHLEIHKGGGSIPDFSAIQAGSGLLWRFKGKWVRDGDLDGQLQVGGAQGTGKLARLFLVHGQKNNLSVHPKEQAASREPAE